MSEFKFYKIVLFMIVFMIEGQLILAQGGGIDHKENIDKYLLLLKNTPKNCHYLDQLASSYQALNEYNAAIHYYKQVLEFCPDSLLARFQLGVSYYLIMQRDVGLKYMDEAIEMAEYKGKKDLKEMFQEEKKAWKEKWDLVREMPWNKK